MTTIPKGHGGKRAGAGRKPKSATPPPVTAADYDQARARRETALAALAELDLAQRNLELIPADVVQHHWENMVGNMRNKLLALPSRIAGAVMGQDTVQGIEREAMLLVREALEEIAQDGMPDGQ